MPQTLRRVLLAVSKITPLDAAAGRRCVPYSHLLEHQICAAAPMVREQTTAGACQEGARSLRRCVVRKTSALDWCEREIAQLRAEAAFLRELLRANTPHGQEPADTQGQGMETSTPQRTLTKETNHTVRSLTKKRMRSSATSPGPRFL